MKYTDEQLNFVRKACRELTLVELTISFNIAFGMNIKTTTMKSVMGNNRITSGRTGRFEPGHVPANAGTKGMGICKPNSGSFKKGSIPKTVKPIGSERICSKDGYILIKIAERNPYTGHKTRYKAKHIVTWEAANGKVPKGMIVRFIDGNRMDPSIENLEMISMRLNLELNRSKYNEAPDEVKRSIRLMAEIRVKQHTLTDRRKK